MTTYGTGPGVSIAVEGEPAFPVILKSLEAIREQLFEANRAGNSTLERLFGPQPLGPATATEVKQPSCLMGEVTLVLSDIYDLARSVQQNAALLSAKL